MVPSLFILSTCGATNLLQEAKLTNPHRSSTSVNCLEVWSLLQNRDKGILTKPSGSRQKEVTRSNLVPACAHLSNSTKVRFRVRQIPLVPACTRLCYLTQLRPDSGSAKFRSSAQDKEFVNSSSNRQWWNDSPMKLKCQST